MTSDGPLTTSEEVDRLTPAQVADLYQRFVNPGIRTFLRVLGLDQIRVVRAQGMHLDTADGRRILDFSGGLNVLNLGHNHPRIMAARRRYNEELRLELWKTFISPHQAVLARNLATLFPGRLRYSFFCNSGAEANEGALKIALLYQGAGKTKMRTKILHTDLGYHGKTLGTLAVSGSKSGCYRELFPVSDCGIEVPFGNIDSVRAAIVQRRGPEGHDIAAMIIEAIKGDLVLTPPDGYLDELGELCRREGIVLIVDEVFTGFGRTGRMFGFQHSGLIPDIVTFSKTLGGGKASIAGYIVREDIFEKTYGSLRGCTIHTSTYGGMGEECATAVEALNILADEGLVERSRRLGERLGERMRALHVRYPKVIRQVRNVGLMGILELRPSAELFGTRLLSAVPHADQFLLGLGPAVIVSELFKRHDILIYTGGREDNLFVNPALIVTAEEIDRFCDALDAVLGRNLYDLALRLLKNIVAGPSAPPSS
ncbi:MAG: aspartate aminotransferase family protein [Deltaproteobacteria bacterium]|nr:aspartate aminotransferase family protein [Deltaproteobacteria bacterium]